MTLYSNVKDKQINVMPPSLTHKPSSSPSLPRPLEKTRPSLLPSAGFTPRGGRFFTVSGEECFTKNDIVLANRPNLLLSKHLSYNHSTVMAAPYGIIGTTYAVSVPSNSSHRVNLTSYPVSGKTTCDGVTDNGEVKEFRELVAEVVENSGSGNPADYLPVLNWAVNYEKKLVGLLTRVLVSCKT
ncbi:hypothetical protein F3Y22_tig00000329pilonHSYRG00364 [Hibiscus syriacus]|uniref:Uncharacterized protein n=1 Tax=Hibiscus syriacus TaxID=106335 RepID=A0A6A3D292_HIBSY|nr:hypothetical protein F3Y22_tig00000329pilonHSYRG00364 [Hibiscus syriacus]